MLAKNRYSRSPRNPAVRRQSFLGRGLIRSLSRSLCLSALSLTVLGVNAIVVNQNALAQNQQIVDLSSDSSLYRFALA